jgi:hypothetical protein
MFDPWLDEEDLLPGQDWQQEILKAVRSSDATVVCLSPNSISKSGFVQKEIRFAIEKAAEQPEGTIFLIPLKLKECEIPEQLKCWHVCNYYEKGSYSRLRKSLQLRAAALGKIQPPVDIANHSTVERGFKAYLSSSWKFINALLIPLLVIIFLLLELPPSPTPKLEFDPQKDGMGIWNTNDYPITSLKAYLTAYKIDKVQHKIIDKLPEVDVPDLITSELAPENYTKIPAGNLTDRSKSPKFGALPNSDEITVLWILKITFNPGKYVFHDNKQGVVIAGEKVSKIKPFLIPDINGQKDNKEKEIISILLKEDKTINGIEYTVYIDNKAYKLPNTMQ